MPPRARSQLWKSSHSWSLVLNSRASSKPHRRAIDRTRRRRSDVIAPLTRPGKPRDSGMSTHLVLDLV
jgi:hypothetical protein